jgi:membrane associated rhomboid family serine protease
VAAGEWYRLITSAFVVPGAGLNGLGFMDILFNMWALVFVGPSLRGLLGRVRFLAVYLLSAVGGWVMYYYLVSLGPTRGGCFRCDLRAVRGVVRGVQAAAPSTPAGSWC